MKKLVTTPLSNTIWWATVNEKSGTMNTSTRVDVTDNAVDAVFQHLINLEGFTVKNVQERTHLTVKQIYTFFIDIKEKKKFAVDDLEAVIKIQNVPF